MRLVSFDPLRTLDIPGVRHVKPDHWLRHRDHVLAADWILFPEHWQVDTLTFGLKKAIFPSLSSYHLGHNKVDMTRAFEALFPQHIPLTLIRAATDAGVEEILDVLSLPFIVKEPRSSMGLGVRLIHSAKELRSYALGHNTLYAQEYLAIDRDLRVVVVGEEVVCAYWRIGRHGSLHNNVARGASVSFEDVPYAALQIVLQMAHTFGIDHAGFDIAFHDGQYYFFEFNMRFGTQSIHRLGIELGSRIESYLRRQQRRLNLAAMPLRGGSTD
jgi:ribosomal protein S6--L-glutamate ligase